MTDRKIGELISLDLVRRRKANHGGPEPVIAKWKCREPTCVVQVGVTQTAFDTLAMFNEVLRSRHKPPIAEREVMFCPDCARRWHEREQEKP